MLKSKYVNSTVFKNEDEVYKPSEEARVCLDCPLPRCVVKRGMNDCQRLREWKQAHKKPRRKKQ